MGFDAISGPNYIVSNISLASSIVLRDGNQNAYANNFVSAAESTTATGGTTVLTTASARTQSLTGTLSHTFQLPDATTLTQIGATFWFNNNSSQSLTITNNGGSTVAVVPAGGMSFVISTLISTSNGAWDAHSVGPVNITWSSNSFRINNTTPIVAGGAAAFLAFSTSNFGIFFGSGAPSVSAAKGSLYLRSDGTTTNDRVYVNTSGGTTWTAVITVA